jgi:hypothetical protein
VREKLQEYALLAEIVGGIAIVVSLLFVGLQVRQSNSLVTTDTIRDGTQLWTSAYRAAFGSSESTAFFRKAINDCDDLTADEQGRFFSTLGLFMAAYDNIYNQYEAGRLGEEIFVSIALNYYGIVNMPCAQQTMSRDFRLLPPWLVDYSVADVLSDHVDDMTLPTFLAQ